MTKKEKMQKLLRNRKTPIAVLKRLSRNADPMIRKGVAINSSTPVDILIKLSEDPSEDVRQRIAYSKRTPVDILIKLSEDPDDLVRARVAFNVRTPMSTLEKLSRDDSAKVRISLAQNWNITMPMLKLLALDPDIIRTIVSRWYSTMPGSIIRELSKSTNDEKYLREIYRFKNIPIDVLFDIKKRLYIPDRDFKYSIKWNEWNSTNIINGLSAKQKNIIISASKYLHMFDR